METHTKPTKPAKYTISIPGTSVNYINDMETEARYFREKLFSFIHRNIGFSYTYYNNTDVTFPRQLSDYEINRLKESGLYLEEAEESAFINDIIKKLVDNKEYTAIKIIIEEFC